MIVTDITKETKALTAFSRYFHNTFEVSLLLLI